MNSEEVRSKNPSDQMSKGFLERVMGICPGTVVPIASALPRCRVAQTVPRTVCYCSLFDSHPYKKREAVPKGTTSLLERVMGIEPTRPAWKAGILPLNYTRKSTTGIDCLNIIA